MMSLLSIVKYIAKLWAKYYNFEQNTEQNTEHNRLEKEMPERKLGEKKQNTVDSSLFNGWLTDNHIHIHLVTCVT